MIIMAVDLGEARTGLAVCDEGERLASPAGVLRERREDALVEAIARAAKERRAGLLVVGFPRNMDGSVGARARESARIAERLGYACGLPCELWDERRTTMAAHAALNAADVRGRRRKAVVDTVAAAIILQEYLDARRTGARGQANR